MLLKHAVLICQNINTSDFRVENNLVKIKKKDGKEIDVIHYNSLLPDGYYFCSEHISNSRSLE